MVLTDKLNGVASAMDGLTATRYVPAASGVTAYFPEQPPSLCFAESVARLDGTTADWHLRSDR